MQKIYSLARDNLILFFFSYFTNGDCIVNATCSFESAPVWTQSILLMIYDWQFHLPMTNLD